MSYKCDRLVCGFAVLRFMFIQRLAIVIEDSVVLKFLAMKTMFDFCNLSPRLVQTRVRFNSSDDASRYCVMSLDSRSEAGDG